MAWQGCTNKLMARPGTVRLRTFWCGGVGFGKVRLGRDIIIKLRAWRGEVRRGSVRWGSVRWGTARRGEAGMH